MSNTLPIPMPRNLFLNKPIDGESIGTLSSSVLSINDNDRFLKDLYAVYGIQYDPAPIKLYIDCYGGYVYPTLGFIGIMEKSETPVSTIVTGCAMSGAFAIAVSGHKGLRYAYKNSTWMYHSISAVHTGMLADLEQQLEQSKELRSMMEAIVVEKTRVSAEDLKRYHVEKYDKYYGQGEAKKLKIFDEIVK